MCRRLYVEPQVIQRQVNDGRGVERQQLADDQAATIAMPAAGATPTRYL